MGHWCVALIKSFLLEIFHHTHTYGRRPYTTPQTETIMIYYILFSFFVFSFFFFFIFCTANKFTHSTSIFILFCFSTPSAFATFYDLVCTAVPHQHFVWLANNVDDSMTSQSWTPEQNFNGCKSTHSRTRSANRTKLIASMKWETLR